MDTIESVTTLTSTSITGTMISDGHLSRATPAGCPTSGDNSGLVMERSGCTDALGKSEPCAHRFKMLKRYHNRENRPPAWCKTRLLGKPESFDGGAGWQDWSVVFRNFACACSALLGVLLERTETSARPVLNATLARAARNGHYRAWTRQVCEIGLMADQGMYDIVARGAA